jgi:hypothetical protein
METIPTNTFALCYPDGKVLLYQTKNGEIRYAWWLQVRGDEVFLLAPVLKPEELDIAEEKFFIREAGLDGHTHRMGYFTSELQHQIYDVALAA